MQSGDARLRLSFSEAVDPVTAEVAGNYTVTGAGVDSARVDGVVGKAGGVAGMLGRGAGKHDESAGLVEAGKELERGRADRAERRRR